MKYTVIKNEQQLKKYSDILIKLSFKSELTKDEKDEVDLLTLLIHDYESKNYVFEASDPIEIIKFMLEQQELTRDDLKNYIGSMSKVSEILSKKRPLSIRMIRNLSEGLHIPASLLIKQYPLSKNA